MTGFAVTSTVIYGVVLGTLAVYVATRAVEGSRKATDRLVTCLVTTAFGIAMIPLVSLVYTVLDNGLARFDGQFFTNSMFRVVGEGGGAYHAIIGTLIITALATLISVPIGLMTAIYLVEYGTRPAQAGHHLLRRRHDRHPVDRRRPLRLRAVHPALRQRRPAWASWARSPSRC